MLSNNNTAAKRVRHYNHGLLFTSHPLEPEELFEVRGRYVHRFRNTRYEVVILLRRLTGKLRLS